MAKGNTFTDSSAKRIADNVRWGEGVRRLNTTLANVPNKPQHLDIYAQLTVKDEDDYGYWKAEEVKLEDGAWAILDGGRKWDGDEYPYIRHINWEDAQKGSIIQPFQVQDIASEDNPNIWVFDKEVTNPQAFIFYADGTGNTGQSTGADTWTMSKGGSVYTNSGKMEIPDGFQMAAGKAAFAKLEFIYITSEWILANAEMVIDEDPEYWEEDGYGTLTIHVKIASTEIKKDVCRLTQHHAGDIRFELHKDVTVTSGSPWISVTNFASNYSVAHILPPYKHQDEFLTFTGNCDDIPTGSFEDFIYWFTNNLVHIRYDQLGHIYERENCYGDIEDYTDDEEDDDGNELKLAGNLTAAATGSNIQPWFVNDDGVSINYRVLNGVKNYTDYVGVEDTMVLVVNDLGNIIPTDLDNDVLGGPWETAQVAKTKNITGTSGITYSVLRLRENNFRFNSSITVKAGIVNKGLGDQEVLEVAACTATITASSEIRDYEDPNATDYTVQVSYSLADIANGSYTKIDFNYGDGDPVQYRFGNSGQFISGPSSLENQGGAGSPTETKTVQFFLRDGTSHGDVIKVTSRLFSFGDTDMNVYQSGQLYVAAEDECVTDDSGEHATGVDGDCATDDTDTTVPYVPDDTYHFKFITTTTEFISQGNTYTLVGSSELILNNVDASIASAAIGAAPGFIRWESGPFNYEFRDWWHRTIAKDIYVTGSSPSNDNASGHEITTQTYFVATTTAASLASKGYPVDRDVLTEVYVRRTSQGDSPW